MNNTAKPIIAAPTARGDHPLEGERNILTDALYEMGYNSTLVDASGILVERNVIDFSIVNDTDDIMDQLGEHYGESALWDDNLEGACRFVKVLTAFSTGENLWKMIGHTLKGNTFQERSDI